MNADREAFMIPPEGMERPLTEAGKAWEAAHMAREVAGHEHDDSSGPKSVEASAARLEERAPQEEVVVPESNQQEHNHGRRQLEEAEETGWTTVEGKSGAPAAPAASELVSFPGGPSTTNAAQLLKLPFCKGERQDFERKVLQANPYSTLEADAEVPSTEQPWLETEQRPGAPGIHSRAANPAAGQPLSQQDAAGTEPPAQQPAAKLEVQPGVDESVNALAVQAAGPSPWRERQEAKEQHMEPAGAVDHPLGQEGAPEIQPNPGKSGVQTPTKSPLGRMAEVATPQNLIKGGKQGRVW